MRAALCVGRHKLFDSTHPGDHIEAAALCARCPVIDWCRERRDATQQITPWLRGGVLTGTWAGELYGITGRGKRRTDQEEAMFSVEEARAAHRAYSNGVRDDRSCIGERVYQRRVKRAQKARAA